MKKLMFLAASAAMMLASCTEKMDFTQADLQNAANPSNEVQFGTYMGRTATTRAATPVDKSYTKGGIGNADGDIITDLKKARFGVFGYFTQANTWESAARNVAPNFMYNQELIYSTANPTNMWIYSPVKYWPNGIDAANATGDPSNTAIQNAEGKLSFFAVAPFTTTPTGTYNDATDGAKPSNISTNDHVKQNSATSGIRAMTTNAATSDVWVKYLMPNASEKEAVDLLWGVRGQYSYTETDGENNTVDALGNVYNVDLTKQSVGERVKFLFKHALAKIGGSTAQTSGETTTGDPAKCGFKVVVDIDGNGNETAGADNQTNYFESGFTNTQTLVTLKEVKIRDLKSVVTDGDVTGVTTGESNLNTYGWFNIETGTWCNESGTIGNNGTGATYRVVANNDATLNNDTYLLNEKILEIGAGKYDASGTVKKLKDATGKEWSTQNPTGVTTSPTNLFANENVPGLMVIPGGSADIYITVDYFVRTADPNLAAGYSEVEQVITNKVNLSALESNKYYTIIMHLGLTSVKFEAVVADWVSNNGTEFNEDGTAKDPTTPTENRTSIWLPSNVVSASNIHINVASDATSSSVTLDGMASGAYTSSNTSVIASGTATAGRNKLNITLTPNLTNQPVETTLTITDAASKVTTITITQAADATYTLTSTIIGKAASSTGTITVTGGTVSSVTATTTPTGLTASVSGNVVTYTASDANNTDQVKTYEGIVLTINNGSQNYVYTTSITQAKD